LEELQKQKFFGPFFQKRTACLASFPNAIALIDSQISVAKS
jgi:hypothetical protein